VATSAQVSVADEADLAKRVSVPSENAPRRRSAASAALEEAVIYWDLIKGVYERKNPAKLLELSTMMSKFAGRELELYTLVCEKYGETPAKLDVMRAASSSGEARDSSSTAKPLPDKDVDTVRLGAAAAAALLQASEALEAVVPSASSSLEPIAKPRGQWDDFEIIDEVASEVSQSLDGDRTEEEPRDDTTDGET